MKRPFQATLFLAQLCTGAVVVDMLFTPKEYSQVSGGHVTFAPGARTAWHTHPRGQTLIVTSGKGWVLESNGQVA